MSCAGRKSFFKEFESPRIGLTAKVALDGCAERLGIVGSLPKQRHRRVQFQIIERAEYLMGGAIADHVNRAGTLDEAITKQRVGEICMSLVQPGIENLIAVGEWPRPASCGKMNHIQWPRLCPARNSPSTCG